MDRYVKAVSNSHFHGFDITLLILAKMLKVVIAVIHPEYMWMSTPDVNVREASVVIIYDGADRFFGTGTLLVIYSKFDSTHH